MPGDIVTVLSPGQLSPVLLVDFLMFSDKPTLATLLQQGAGPRGLYQIDGVRAFAAAGPRPSLTELSAVCAAALERLPVEPVVVVGYCSAAVLALSIWERLRGLSAPRPALILVNPSLVDDELIRTSFAEMQESLGARPAPGLPGAVALDTMLAALADQIAAKLAAEELDQDEIELMSEVLIERYAHWLGFLVASRDVVAAPPGTPVQAVLSADQSFLPPADWPQGLVETCGLEEDAGAISASGRLLDLICRKADELSA